jgi:hypothetical protein
MRTTPASRHLPLQIPRQIPRGRSQEKGGPAMSTAIQLTSRLTCPECGAARDAEMPADACQFFYPCPDCGAVLRPLPGDCCVFCSYGSVSCPPVQRAGSR